MFWHCNEKKSKMANRQERISAGDSFEDIQPFYSIDSLLSLTKRQVFLMANRRHNEEQKLHFLTLSLLPFLSDAAFHDCLETRRRLQKEQDPHYKNFDLGNICWMLHSDNNELLQFNNYNAFCVRKYSWFNVTIILQFIMMDNCIQMPSRKLASA